MPGQAPAASEEEEASGGVGESIKSAASEAAEVAKEAILDDDEVNDGHDEL